MTTLNASKTLPQSGPRHQMTTNARTSAARAMRPCAQPLAIRPAPSSCGASLRDGDPGDARVDLLEPPRDRGPGVLLDGERAGRVAQRRAPRLVVDERAHGVGERVRVVRRARRRRPRRSAPRDSRGCPTRRPGARTRTRASAPCRSSPGRSTGATSAFAPSSVRVSSSWLRKPTTSIPSSGTRRRVSRRRTASGSAPATVSRSPERRWMSGQARSRTWSPLRGSCLPANTTRCSRPPAGADGGTQHAVRNHLVLARQPAVLRRLRALRDRDAVVDPVDEKAPERRRRRASSRARRTRGTSRRAGTGRG